MSFSACSGNFAQVELNDSVGIPENGIIEKSVLERLKSENSIATFTGVSGEIKYEWIIFGSDIEATRDINLSLDLTKAEKEVKIKFSEKQDLGFPALLYVYLNEKWKDNSATAYCGDEVVLHCEEIWFRYEKDLPDVVKSFSLTLHRGEFYAILGGNGAGKTTEKTLLAYYVTGLPMDLVHAFGTVIFIMLAAEPMLEKMDRIKVKYGIAE